MQVTESEAGVAAIWLLDLAMFCWLEVSLVIDLWRPPDRPPSKLFSLVMLLCVGNLPVDLESTFDLTTSIEIGGCGLTISGLEPKWPTLTIVTPVDDVDLSFFVNLLKTDFEIRK